MGCGGSRALRHWGGRCAECVAQDGRSSLLRHLAHDRHRHYSRLSYYTSPAPAVTTQPRSIGSFLPTRSPQRDRSCPLRPRPACAAETTPTRHPTRLPKTIITAVQLHTRHHKVALVSARSLSWSAGSFARSPHAPAPRRAPANAPAARPRSTPRPTPAPLSLMLGCRVARRAWRSLLKTFFEAGHYHLRSARLGHRPSGNQQSREAHF